MPRPRSELARRSVLTAMRSAIAAGAYESLTIEGLAAAAGVSKQTIYRWWRSKTDIMGEAMLEGEIPGAPPELAETDDLAADLRAWLAASIAMQAQPEQAAVARALIAVTATNPEVGAALNQRFAGPVLAWIVRRIEAAQTAGEVRGDADPALIADQFLAVASYTVLIARPLSDEQIAAIVDHVLRGVRAD